MKDKNSLILLRVIFVATTALLLAFIFSQSLLPAEDSSEESDRVLKLLNSILSTLGIGPVLTHNFVRKLAHFTEFALLGISFNLTFISFKIKPYYFALYGFLLSVITAVTDECLQIISPGRSCQISDMLLDSSGGLAASLIVTIAMFIIIKIKRKKSLLNE